MRDKVSLRTCIVTRVARPPEELIRFALSPDGKIVPDVSRKLPGRGVWVTCSRSCVEKAQSSGFFARALRRKIEAAPDLGQTVDRLLVKRALELLSICNKAGLVATGRAKVNAWIEAGAAGVLLQGADASADGLEKVARKYRAVSLAANRQPNEVSLLTIDELSLAIGRANVVHAALSNGSAATNFLAAASRVAQYRQGATEASTPKVAEQAAGAEQAATRNAGTV